MALILLIIILSLIIIAIKLKYFLISDQKSGHTKVSKTYLPKNITLHKCSVPQSDTQLGRPLALIFAWINAKEKNLDKFRQLWLQKGFDVLTVRTTLFEALFPSIGSQVIAKNVTKVLSNFHSEYNEIVVHSFSVGGYQFGEVLVYMRDRPQYANVLNSFKGLIMDSIVYAKDRAPGIARTLTHNPTLQSVIERVVDLFFQLFHNVIIKHYNNSEELIVRPPINYQGLIFYSRDDMLSSFDSNENLVKNWIKKGNDIRVKSWDKSGHVLHYRSHQKEYERELDAFVATLKLKNILI